MTEPTDPIIDHAPNEPDTLLHDVLYSQFIADQILATQFEVKKPGQYAMEFTFPPDDKRIDVEYVTMNQMMSAALEAAYCAMSAGIRDGSIASAVGYQEYLAGRAKSMVGGVYCKFPQRLEPNAPAKLDLKVGDTATKTTKSGQYVLVRIETSGFLQGYLECLIEQPNTTS